MQLPMLKPQPGTYLIIFRCNLPAAVRVGRWGRLDLQPGFYAYVGSAFGPGGVRARVLNHLRKRKTKHWHLDYLSKHVWPTAIWQNVAGPRLEHRWASRMAAEKQWVAIGGFGSSDCRCQAHLFFAGAEPKLRWLAAEASRIAFM